MPVPAPTTAFNRNYNVRRSAYGDACQLRIGPDWSSTLDREHAPVPQILKETVEVVRFFPWKRVQQRIADQIVELFIPQIAEEITDVVRLFRQERVQQRIDEQLVEVFAGKEEKAAVYCSIEA